MDIKFFFHISKVSFYSYSMYFLVTVPVHCKARHYFSSVSCLTENLNKAPMFNSNNLYLVYLHVKLAKMYGTCVTSDTLTSEFTFFSFHSSDILLTKCVETNDIRHGKRRSVHSTPGNAYFQQKGLVHCLQKRNPN